MNLISSYICIRKTDNSNRKLYIYYAENPEGPYTEHPCNPVVVDDTMARPAGSMFKDGEIGRASCRERV